MFVFLTGYWKADRAEKFMGERFIVKADMEKIDIGLQSIVSDTM